MLGSFCKLQKHVLQLKVALQRAERPTLTANPNQQIESDSVLILQIFSKTNKYLLKKLITTQRSF